MAFIQIKKHGPVFKLGKRQTTIEGFLTSVEISKSKKFRGNFNVVFGFTQTDGTVKRVYGPTAMSQELLVNKGEDLNIDSELDPALVGKLVRCKFLGLKKIPGRPKPMQDISVEADLSKSIKTGKTYQLDKSKKFVS